MPDLVRIRDTTSRAEYSVGARRAAQLVERGGVELVTDGDATDRLGRALPASQAPTKSRSTTGTTKEQTR